VNLSPSLYDLLDVDSTASDTEIRAAWRTAIADLDPSDRRFRAYNQAAEVLLDPKSRAAYDAELTTSDDEAPEPIVTEGHGPPPAAAPVDEPPSETATGRTGLGSRLTNLKGRLARPGPTTATTSPGGTSAAGTSAAGTSAAADRQLVPAWLLIGLAVLVAVLVAGVVYLANQPSDTEIEESTREAQSAAERAIVPVLSYDAKTLDEDQAAAHAQMTSDYREDYDKLFESIKENAPRTGTVVTAEAPFASGIVRSGEDRVQVLLFLNRPTTNKARPEPVVFRDQVTVTMQKVGEDWLIDDLKTSPVSP
jgi:Mce-associated membrane protein